MIGEAEFQAFLHRPEGPTLDFKRGNYDFAQPDARNAFIKDVISMANTPRQGPSHIVLGVDWTPEGGHKLVGLAEQRDDSFLRDKLGVDRVAPVPSILYHPILFQELQFGVIEILVEKRGPFLPTKSLGEFLREGQLYVRRGTQNVAANSDEVRAVHAWFVEGRLMTKSPDQSDAWRQFMEAVHRFEAGRAFILVADCFEETHGQSLRGWGLGPWCGVFDLDPNSDVSGFLQAIDETLSSQRTVVRTVKGDRPFVYPDTGTIWFFARGLNGRDGTLETGTYTQWLRQYGREVDLQFERIISAVAPSPITVVVLWTNPGLSRHLSSLVESAVRMGGESVDAVVVSPDRSLPAEACSQHGVQVVEATTTSLSAGLEDFLAGVERESGGRYAIPTASGAPRVIEPKDRLWLEEELEIVHLDTGLKGADTPDLFRKGDVVSWQNLNLSHDCVREITERLRRKIEGVVQQRRTWRVNLYHAPGAGGTTVARRVIWDLHSQYPCVVLRRSDPARTAERLAKLTALSEQGLVLLIDGGEHSEREVDDLHDRVASQQTPVTIVQVLRRFTKRPSSRWEFWLPAELAPAEVTRFLAAYTAAAPQRQRALEQLETSTSPRERTAFYFGLQAFGRDFQGLPRFVAVRLRELTDVQRQIVGFLATAHHYGQQPLPAQAFAGMLSLPLDRRVDLTRALPASTFDLLVEAEPGVWRTSHELIAEETLRQVLCPQERDRERLWRQQLSAWAVEFAHFARSRSQILSDRMLELTRRVFVYRDNVELLGTEQSVNQRFSRLMEDIPSPHGRMEVLQTLAQVFPEEAHFHAHLGRFCGLQGRFREGLEAIDRALRLRDQDPVLHHMRGMIQRYRVTELIGGRAQVDSVVETARDACASFERCRQIDPGNEHGFISEIQLLLHVLDYAARGHSSVQAYLFSTDANPYVRESMDRAEVLLDGLRNARAGQRPSNYEESCRARLSELYGDHLAALQGWDNLLARKDIVKPPIRRQIVWTLLHRRVGKWETLETKDVRRCVDLLESNLSEDPNDESSLRLWMRAVRYLSAPPTFDRLIERAGYWKANTGALDAAFYLYVLHTLVALEGSVLAPAEAERALEDCRSLSRLRRNRHWSIEWLGVGDGVRQLVHVSELGPWVEGFWENRRRLARVRGRIASIGAPQRGFIELTNGQRAFFVPAIGGFNQGRHENQSVEFFLGFSYDGPRAWEVALAG